MTSSQTSTRVVLVTGSSVRGLLVTHYYTDRVFINRGQLRVLLERERERAIFLSWQEGTVLDYTVKLAFISTFSRTGAWASSIHLLLGYDIVQYPIGF